MSATAKVGLARCGYDRNLEREVSDDPASKRSAEYGASRPQIIFSIAAPPATQEWG